MGGIPRMSGHLGKMASLLYSAISIAEFHSPDAKLTVSDLGFAELSIVIPIVALETQRARDLFAEFLQSFDQEKDHFEIAPSFDGNSVNVTFWTKLDESSIVE